MNLSGVRPSVHLSVRLSVRSIIRPPHAAAIGLLLSAVPTGDIDQERAAVRHSEANTGSATWSADVGSCASTCSYLLLLVFHHPLTLPL